MIGLLANSILSFAGCLAKGTNNNAAKNNIIRGIMVTLLFCGKGIFTVFFEVLSWRCLPFFA